MSLSLTNVQQTEFDELVKIEYRARGFKLRGTMRERNDVVGRFVQFRKMGQVIAYPVGFQNTINIQDAGFTPITCTLDKYAAGQAVDEVQDLTVNFDSKQELAIVAAQAVGRRSDQIAIVAIAANPSITIPDGGTNMSYTKLLTVVSYFEDNAVPLEQRFLALSANNMKALLADDHFTSRLYTSHDAVQRGTLDWSDILGLNLRVIPAMTEGGLPKVGNIRTALAWHQDAVGMGIGQDLKVKINLLPREDSWFVNATFFAGAAVIDNRGVFAINCDESV